MLVLRERAGVPRAPLPDQQPLGPGSLKSHTSHGIRFGAERELPSPEPLSRFHNTAPYVYKIPNNERPFGDGKKGWKPQRRDESVYKMDPARTATKVITAARTGGFRPRAPPEGLLVAEGVGREPVEEPGEDEELPPVALVYKYGRTERRQRKKKTSQEG